MQDSCGKHCAWLVCARRLCWRSNGRCCGGGRHSRSTTRCTGGCCAHGAPGTSQRSLHRCFGGTNTASWLLVLPCSCKHSLCYVHSSCAHRHHSHCPQPLTDGRGYRYRTLRAATVTAQASARRTLQQARYHRTRAAALRAQAQWRMAVQRRRYMRLHAGVMRAQARCRPFRPLFSFQPWTGTWSAGGLEAAGLWWQPERCRDSRYCTRSPCPHALGVRGSRCRHAIAPGVFRNRYLM